MTGPLTKLQETLFSNGFRRLRGNHEMSDVFVSQKVSVPRFPSFPCFPMSDVF